MSVFNLDREQLLDNKGRPIVNATIYIGQGNRDPEFFPKLAYSNQARTSELGTQLTTDDAGRFPKAYIEPPYSYRIRLEDGSQYDEELFSFGIVEIDYTPGGSGAEAIGLSTYLPADGTVTTEMLDLSAQAVLAQVGINQINLSQEIQDRAAAVLQESLDRAAAVQAALDAVQNAIDLSDAGDAQIQAELNTVSQATTVADVTANAALTDANTALTRLDDTRGDGSNVSIESIALNQQTTESTIVDQQLQLTAIGDRTTLVETQLSDVYGDGSNINLSSFAQDTETIKTDVTTAQFTADSAVTSSNQALSRLGDTSGDGTNVAIEALAARTINTESQVSTNAIELIALDNRQTVTESIVEDVYGDGSNISLSIFAGDFQTTQAQINNPITGLSATRNLAVTTEARMNDVDGNASGRTIEQLSADFVALEDSVAIGLAGTATIDSVNEVSVRVDGVEDRLNDTVGDGSNQTIEVMASSLSTTAATASQAGIDALAAVSQANAANVRIDNLGSEPVISSISTQLSTTSAQVNDPATGNAALSATVTSQSSAIASLQNGVGALWEVEASAAGVTGAIGLYNQNGNTRVLMKADDVQIDRGSGPLSLFTPDGALDALFQNNFTYVNANNVSFTYGGTASWTSFSSHAVTLPSGLYQVEVSANLFLNNVDPSAGVMVLDFGLQEQSGGTATVLFNQTNYGTRRISDSLRYIDIVISDGSSVIPTSPSTPYLVARALTSSTTLVSNFDVNIISKMVISVSSPTIIRPAAYIRPASGTPTGDLRSYYFNAIEMNQV